MARVRIPMLLCVALLASVFASAADVPKLRGSLTAVSGVYSLTFNLNLATQLPAGTTITCRAQVVPNQPAIDSGNRQPAVVPVRATAGQASVAGPNATCATEIPFSWTVTSERGGAVLSYEIDAVNNSGSVPLVVWSSGRQNVGLALPGFGGSTNLSFYLTF
jgi:hypothetical protein